MKARTRIEKAAVEASSKLLVLTKAQYSWALKLLSNFSYVTKKKCVCLSCGHIASSEFRVCPECHKNMTRLEGKVRTGYDYDLFHILTKKDGFQIIRYFLIEKTVKVGVKENVDVFELGRCFFKDGKTVYLGRNKSQNCWYVSKMSSRWVMSCDLSVKKNIPRLITVGYPRKKIIPILKRNGFNGESYNLDLIPSIRRIYHSRQVETFLKIGQLELYKYLITRNDLEDDLFKAALIANRHNYKISDATLWIDYVKMLKTLKKDIKNPQFLCPIDLKEAHDQVDLAIKKQQGELKRIQLMSDNHEYIKRISKYKDFVEEDGNLKITVLQSVWDFQKEGTELKHCVFSREYYKLEDALILSAKVNNQRTETIEIGIKDMSLRQVRGLSNLDSEFHEQIVQVVENKILPKLKRL